MSLPDRIFGGAASTAHWFDQRLTRELLQWEPAVTIDEGYRRLGLFYGDKYSRSSAPRENISLILARAGALAVRTAV